MNQDDITCQSGRPTGRTVDGVVRDALPHAMFAVELDDGSRVVTHIAGSLQPTLVRLVPGDRVTVQLSPYDLSRGRITRRHRAGR